MADVLYTVYDSNMAAATNAEQSQPKQQDMDEEEEEDASMEQREMESGDDDEEVEEAMGVESSGDEKENEAEIQRFEEQLCVRTHHMHHAPLYFSNKADGDTREVIVDDKELLVAEITKYKHLYDSSSKDHRNSQAVNNYWCEIASTLGQEEEWEEKDTRMTKARKGSLLDIMKAKITKKREREESDEELSVPYKLHKELLEKYIPIRNQNEDYELLLAEKTAKIHSLQEKNKELSEELKTIRCLNLRLQEQLLSTPGVLKQSGSREVSLDAEPEELDEEGKIKLGPGVFLNKEKWQRVEEAKSHSQFCKSLAVAIWGTEELMERSVTGTKSNAVKDSVPKRPLTPEKVNVVRDRLRDRLRRLNYPKEVIDQQLSLVRRNISEKISDIRKMALRQRGNNTSSTQTAE